VYSAPVGLWAAAFWLGSPLVLALGSSAYIDVGLTLFVTVGMYAFFNWLSDRERMWLVVAGVCTGLAAGSKYMGLFFLGAIGLSVWWVGLRARDWKSPAIFFATSIGVAAPWYYRNFYYTGGALYPFFADMSGGGLWNLADLQEQIANLQSYGTGRTLASLTSLSWNLAWHPHEFGSEVSLSPFLLMVFPITLCVGATDTRSRALCLVILAYVICWFLFAQNLR